MAESIGDAFEQRLRITDRDDSTSTESESRRAAVDGYEQRSVDGGIAAANIMETTSVLSSDGDDVPSPNRTASRRPILMCDAWYGFPHQKRPRKERIHAVGRQLSNFLQWRRRQTVSASSSGVSCRVSFLGNKDDVHAVHDRMDELALADDRVFAYDKNDGVDFQFDVTIHEFLHLERIDEDEDEVLYLSPDAIHTLSFASPPPRIVIIGMLIDRRITANRSLIRAEETLKLKAVKLPLDELNVRRLTCQEPLNVDTVMELMQRWHWNCDRMQKQQHDVDERKALYRDCFLEAAAWAMKSQRERHPNRTIHLE
jgi:hypothetical protein